MDGLAYCIPGSVGDNDVVVEETDEEDGLRVTMDGDDDNDEEEDCIGELDCVIDEGDTDGTLAVVVDGGGDGEVVVVVNSGSILESIDGEMDSSNDVADGRKVGEDDDDAPSLPPSNVNPMLTTPSSSVISKHGVLPVAGSMALSTPGDVNNPSPVAACPSSPTLPIHTGPNSYSLGNCALI